ncbi:MAG: hypothetical protein GX121_01680, partial [Ignavibacteria bacterium]|nr:hypothetical protein [Ignavibacteria bacterium]
MSIKEINKKIEKATCVYNLKGRAEELAEMLEIIEVRTKCETPDHCEYNIGNCGAAHG